MTRAVLVPALLATLVAGCAARYWTPMRDGRIILVDPSSERPIPYATTITTPTLLGWLLPGRPARIDAWGLDDGGQTLLLASIRGQGDLVTTARVVSRSEGRLVVEVTLTDPFLWLMRPAVGLFFVVRVPLDPPIDPAVPLIVVDASSGQETPVTRTFQVADSASSTVVER